MCTGARVRESETYTILLVLLGAHRGMWGTKESVVHKKVKVYIMACRGLGYNACDVCLLAIGSFYFAFYWLFVGIKRNVKYHIVQYTVTSSHESHG